MNYVKILIYLNPDEATELEAAYGYIPLDLCKKKDLLISKHPSAIYYGSDKNKDGSYSNCSIFYIDGVSFQSPLTVEQILSICSKLTQSLIQN